MQPTQRLDLSLRGNVSSPVYSSFYPLGNRSNSTYTINGTGFGTKSSTAYFDDFETNTIVNDPNGISADIGSLRISNRAGASISTSQFFSGSKSLSNNFATEYQPKVYKTLSATQRRHYLGCMFKFTGTWQGPGTAPFKMGRIGGDPNDAYNGQPHAGSTFVAASGAGFGTSFSGEITNPTITSYSADNTAQDPTTAYKSNQWQFYEVEFDAGTLNNSDCTFLERVDNTPTVIWQNRPFLTTATPLLPGWFLTPMNLLDHNPNIICYMDQVYVDESRARVVITNNATYGSSTVFNIQPVITWTDTQITVQKNTPSFTDGATAYRHVFGTTGTLLRSDAVTI